MYAASATCSIECCVLAAVQGLPVLFLERNHVSLKAAQPFRDSFVIYEYMASSDWLRWSFARLSTSLVFIHLMSEWLSSNSAHPNFLLGMGRPRSATGTQPESLCERNRKKNS